MADDALERTRQALHRKGLLMQHDARLPSVTAIVAGAPVHGSWWGHPQAHEIFTVLQAVAHEAACVKLVTRKVTLVHPRLWPAVVTIGTSRSPWQIASLPRDAATVLAELDAREQLVSTDLISPSRRPLATIVTELEQRLLIHTEQRHTTSGKHVRVLTSWPVFARTHHLATLPSIPAAQRELERAVDDWPCAATLLPWSR